MYGEFYMDREFGTSGELVSSGNSFLRPATYFPRLVIALADTQYLTRVAFHVKTEICAIQFPTLRHLAKVEAAPSNVKLVQHIMLIIASY